MKNSSRPLFFVLTATLAAACGPKATSSDSDRSGFGGLPSSTGSGGGAASGAAPSAESGGASSSGGQASAGGTAATGGSAGGDKPPAIPSVGCGKPLSTFTTGTHTITSSSKQREFTVSVPSSYDPTKPYRLIFAWHWIYASDDAVVNGQVSGGGAVWSFYGLRNQADTAGDPAIFIAPQSQNGTWGEEDHVLFDDLLAAAEKALCIDTGRVFSTGFSFGAMQTYSLSTSHQSQLRAVAALSPANFNIYLPTNTHQPIGYMSTTGMSDTLTPWDGGGSKGAKYAAIGHAEDNGCTVPSTIPTAVGGSKAHVCYDFEGCDAGYPVKVCTFDGGHIAAHADGGTGDDGTATWIPKATWDFFSQF